MNRLSHDTIEYTFKKKGTFVVLICIFILICFLLSACSNKNDSAVPSNIENSPAVSLPAEQPVTSAENTIPAANNTQTAVESEEPDTSNTIIGEEDVTAAREAALAYYNTTVFANQITDLERITDSAEYEGAVPDGVESKDIIAFQVTVKDSTLPPRIILLHKDENGNWKKINEGY